jgi:AIPR protein
MNAVKAAEQQPSPDSDSVEVEIVFRGVETPKRLQNAEDLKRGIARHTFDVPAAMIDADALIKLDGPNPRTPNIRKQAAKRLRESLEGIDPARVGAFHLAHGGIRGLVKSFEKIDDNTYKATFEVETGNRAQDHGIANGLHTIAVIQKALTEGLIPRGQYLTFTLVENVDRALVPYIGEGLNTNIQVSEESIIDLGGAFDPFKAAIAGKSYKSEIGWHENQPGQYDARDVFAILNALNVFRYPNTNRDKNPIESYEKPSRVIAAFSSEKDDKKGKEPTSFERLIPILNDALYLYDWIGYDAGARYKDAVPGGLPGGLSIMESRTGKDNEAIPDVWAFPFISEGKPDIVRATYRLSKGVRYAMLAAFRTFVEADGETGTVRWAGGFETVLGAWQALGGDMMATAKDVSQASNYNPNAVGKNRPLWRQLHQMAANYRLEQEAEQLRKELEEFKAKA